MANPRQRRKARSSSHSAVSHSRRAKKLLKKQPPIRGPKVLQDAWDKKKTVRQNYAALGLSASLNPRISGGVENVSAHVEQSASESSSATAPPPGTASTSGLPKGFGRIIRDADGNILSVEVDEDEPQEDDSPASMDNLAENLITGMTPETESWVHGARRDVQARTDVVQALEAQASSKAAAPRFSSKEETAYLRRLIAKHQEDAESMARDRKLNPDQHTAGELRRAIRKAGGFNKLGSLH